MSKQIVICNPPVGFTSNSKTHIGHLFFHTILDATARFRLTFLRENVYMPARAYNLYGLPSQKFMEEHGYTVETYKNAVNKIIEEDWKIRDINLSNADLIFDDSDKVRAYIPELFKKLEEKEALTIINNEIFLTFTNINFEDLSEKINNAKVFPERVKEILIFHLKNNTAVPYKISSTRWFTPDSHIEGIKASPNFVVSNFWDAYFPDSDFILSCSFNLVLKSALLRILTHYLAYGNIGITELIVYPKILGDLPKQIPLNKISDHGLWKDLLRFAFLFTYTSKREKVINDIDSHKGAISFVKDVLDLLERPSGSSSLNVEQTREYQKYLHNMEMHEYRTAISQIRGILKIMKKEQSVSSNNREVLLKMIGPIMPFFSKRLQDTKDTSQPVNALEVSRDLTDEYLSVIQSPASM